MKSLNWSLSLCRDDTKILEFWACEKLENSEVKAQPDKEAAERQIPINSVLCIFVKDSKCRTFSMIP